MYVFSCSTKSCPLFDVGLLALSVCQPFSKQCFFANVAVERTQARKYFDENNESACKDPRWVLKAMCFENNLLHIISY